MTDPVTNNRSLTQPTVGGDAGTWGGILNTGTIGQLDLVLGNTQPVSVTSADVTLSQAQWNNLALSITGTLTGARNLFLPFSPNSTTAAVGGSFVVLNNTTGSFNLTVSTTASGATGVVAYQGLNTALWSDQTNVRYLDDSAARFTPVNGNPNGQLAGTAATVNNPPHPLAWDYSGGTGAWVPTTTGTSTSAVWAQISGIGAPLPVPEGYLTAVSSTPVITSDASGATVIYYTPFTGTWALVHNGTQIIPYQFSQLQLTLTSSQAANNIYDIFLAYNGGTPVIGTGPSWSAGTGGSITAGSCARGTGAGGTALARLQGVWTNAASMSLIYNTGSGNTTITVAANQGVYVGSVWIDATAGQYTCNRSYGQNRKFGLFNANNRTPITLTAGDSTATWAYGANTLRASNNAPSLWSTNAFNAGSGTTCNGLTTFTALPEEIISVRFVQLVNVGANGITKVGIGVNSVSAASGLLPSYNLGAVNTVMESDFYQNPTLGINTFSSLEQVVQGAGNTFNGTQSNMILSAQYRG